MACSAYVDLNLIRAAMAETIEQSDFTSAQRRTESIQVASKNPSIESASVRDSFLAPLTIDERNDPIEPCASGPCASRSGKRCSDKGFLSISTLDYLELLDETARITRADKAGATAMDLPPIFERISVAPFGEATHQSTSGYFRSSSKFDRTGCLRRNLCSRYC